MENKEDHSKELEDTFVRPLNVPVRTETFSTYDRMVVESHEVPLRWNFLASLSNWLLLAGFVVFPGTFTSIGRSGVLDRHEAGRLIQRAVRNVPLLYIGSFSCIIGIIGLGWAWWNVKNNWFWLVYRIFLLVFFRSLATLY
ncbi:hypothetical protein SNK03_013384 [Fusarium graminearum]